MHEVVLSYNPYSRRTSLNIDGTERKDSSRRIDTFITGKDIDIWLSPYVHSYRRWNGFVSELMDELNDDELTITFRGTSGDYQRVISAISEQKKIAESNGYSSERLRVLYRERYTPEVVRGTLLKCVHVWRSRAKLQLSLNLLNMAEQELSGTELLTIKNLQSMYDSLVDVLKNELENIPDTEQPRKRVWEKAQKDLDQAFRGDTIQ